MRVSINLSNHNLAESPDGVADGLADIAAAADETGIDTVWLPDHLLQADPTVGNDTYMLEAYTALGFLAADTVRVRLGAMVSAVPFRPPAVLLKAVTTLDVLSRGRAWLGIGAGYLTDEAQAMGLAWPGTAERWELLEDVVRLAQHAWAGNSEPFRGRRTTVDTSRLQPLPVTRPRPRILIGGSGEQRTLRLVALYADACNLFDLPDGGETLRHKLDVLDRHCRDVGRDPGTVERTLSTRQGPQQRDEEFVHHCREVGTWGINHVILHSGPPWTPASVQRLAPLVDALSG